MNTNLRFGGLHLHTPTANRGYSISAHADKYDANSGQITLNNKRIVLYNPTVKKLESDLLALEQQFQKAIKPYSDTDNGSNETVVAQRRSILDDYNHKIHDLVKVPLMQILAQVLPSEQQQAFIDTIKNPSSHFVSDSLPGSVTVRFRKD